MCLYIYNIINPKKKNKHKYNNNKNSHDSQLLINCLITILCLSHFFDISQFIILCSDDLICSVSSTFLYILHFRYLQFFLPSSATT